MLVHPGMDHMEEASMAGDSCMFFWSLSPSECASWVQAWGSIGAILGAFLLARQQIGAANAAARLAAAERRLELAKTLDYLARSTISAIDTASVHLATREHVHTAADTGGLPSLMLMLDHLSRRLEAAPVYGMPADLLRGALLLSGTIDQFIWKVRMAFDTHRSMSAEAFDDFFITIGDIKRSLAESASEIRGQTSEAQRALEQLGGAGKIDNRGS